MGNRGQTKVGPIGNTKGEGRKDESQQVENIGQYFYC
jgi:hypothetical protein